MTQQTTIHSTHDKTGEEIRIGRHVTLVGLWSNIVLSVLKIFAGIYGRSSAMIADGVHSASDLVTDLLVLVVIGMSRRSEDNEHTYGHGKIETFATFIIALLLAAVAVGLAVDGVNGVIDAFRGHVLPRPGWIAFIMALISIAAKEALFHYTRRAGRRIGSAAMEANAWHHRSDAFSSVATLIGIAGAMFLGVRWRVLDPAAAILVSVLILVMSWRLAVGSVRELLEVSLPKEVIAEASAIISTTNGVKAFHHLRTRSNGNRKIFDMHIKVDPRLSIVEAHDIASDVEHRLRDSYGSDTLVNVHIEPYRPAAGGR